LSGATVEVTVSLAVSCDRRDWNHDQQPRIGSTARSREQALPRGFTRAFIDAINHPASGGHEPESLAVDGLVALVNTTTPESQQASVYLFGDGVGEYIPTRVTTGYLRDLDLWTQRRKRQMDNRRRDQRNHVLPLAQGGNDDQRLFTGHDDALAAIVQWLQQPQPSTLVVTGDPGSGKSALLSRLFVLADQRLRARVPGIHLLPAGTLPPVGSIDRFIHALGR